MKSLKIKNSMTGISLKKDYYPSISLPTKAIPELEDKSVGDECTILLKVKITGMNSDNDGTRVNLDLLKGEYAQKGDNEEEYKEED